MTRCHEGIEKVLNRLRGQASYNRIISLEQGDISQEVLVDPALYEMQKEAKAGTEYQAVAKVVADKVPREVVLTMSKHPVKEYQSNMERLSVMEKMVDKSWTRMLIMDYTKIVVQKEFRNAGHYS